MSIKLGSRIKGYAVVDPNSQAAAAPAAAATAASDLRVKLDGAKSLPPGILNFDKRYTSPKGNPSWTYMIESPKARFGIVLGDTGGETPALFEVWVIGEAPRGMNAIAKNLSLDMRVGDRKWLQSKLESLAKTAGDAFDMEMPDGTIARMPSEVAALAKLVLWRGNELGMFEESSETPFIDAMLFKREPKTDANGSLAWYMDIKNPNTGDDFVLYVKEGTMPGTDQIRPISVWLSGDFPKALDGLCKSLSRDMWIHPIDWFVKKLSQLDDIVEPMGDFFAQVPGKEKQQTYPSTVAYIAAVLRHRLKTLGLYNEGGSNVVQRSLHLVKVEPANESAVAEQQVQGNLCPECSHYSVIKISGCDSCQNCSYSKCS